ncbi:MAG TPA: hypothetical protein VFA35_11470, partial [Burkholderiaceae bacterium]|nr:hypothetical protein [Burkholderiaceae bacterium]
MTAPTLPPEAESWLHIGPGTYYAPDIALKVWLPSERVVIGNYCSIAERVSIFTGGMRRTDTAALYPFNVQQAYRSTADTTIGHDVWIGYGATIFRGARIGNGAIVGAGAV